MFVVAFDFVHIISILQTNCISHHICENHDLANTEHGELRERRGASSWRLAECTAAVGAVWTGRRRDCRGRVLFEAAHVGRV